MKSLTVVNIETFIGKTRPTESFIYIYFMPIHSSGYLMTHVFILLSIIYLRVYGTKNMVSTITEILYTIKLLIKKHISPLDTRPTEKTEDNLEISLTQEPCS